jgi:hypothetical protein
MIISNAILIVSQTAIPLALLLDYPLIGYKSHAELRQLLGLATLAYGSVLLNEVILSVEVGFRNAMREIQATHWMAPCESSYILPASQILIARHRLLRRISTVFHPPIVARWEDSRLQC